MSLRYELKDTDLLVFLHIPKTAGTSFANIVGRHFNQDQICTLEYYVPDELVKKIAELPDGEFDNYRYLPGHFQYDIQDYLPKRPIYITMLRDPIERTISMYSYLTKQIWQQKDAVFHDRRNETLYEFVTNPRGAYDVENLQVRWLAGTRYKKGDEQSKKASDAQDLDTVIELLQESSQFPFFGLAERFEESLELLSYTFGWPKQNSVQLNVTKRRTRRERLSQEDLDAIMKCTHYDRLLYDFAHGLFHRRLNEMRKHTS